MAGDLVSWAGASDWHPDDQHFRLPGEEDDTLCGGDQAGLQVHQVPGMPGGACLQLQARPRPQAHPGAAPQEEVSASGQSARYDIRTLADTQGAIMKSNQLSSKYTI